MRIETPRGVAIRTQNGRVELNWNPDFTNRWQGRYSRAQQFVDSEVLRLSAPYTPMQSGMLRTSGILGTAVGSGLVVWNTPYAKYLYYGKVMIGRAPKTLTDEELTFHGAPKRGAFWFERMKSDKGQQILRSAARIAGGRP